MLVRGHRNEYLIASKRSKAFKGLTLIQKYEIKLSLNVVLGGHRKDSPCDFPGAISRALFFL
jgi:hypothetical protein